MAVVLNVIESLVEITYRRNDKQVTVSIGCLKHIRLTWYTIIYRYIYE